MAICFWALSGCIYSVHPLLEPEQFARDTDLSGVWEHETSDKSSPTGKPGKIRVELAGFDMGSSYDMTGPRHPGTEDHPDPLVLNIGRVGQHRFLQFTREELPERAVQRGLPILDGIPVYHFARFDLVGEELRVFTINENWCEHKLDRSTTPFLRRGDRTHRPWTILTASSDKLRELVEKRGEDLFLKEPMIWKRVLKGTGTPAEAPAKSP